jgi:DNA-binding MarR family transcriptional regulator
VFHSQAGAVSRVHYYYTKIHATPLAESDFQRFFRVTPPVVHQMIKTLHALGFIDREPGKARSIRLRLTRAELRLAEGLPYQTLISSLLHKYASGDRAIPSADSRTYLIASRRLESLN